MASAEIRSHDENLLPVRLYGQTADPGSAKRDSTCLKHRENRQDDDRRYIAAKLVNIAQSGVLPAS